MAFPYVSWRVDIRRALRQTPPRRSAADGVLFAAAQNGVGGLQNQ